MKRVYEGTIRLQGVGVVEGIKAKNLKVGDVTVWNFGGTETVKEIRFSKTGKTLVAVVDCNGKEYERKMTAERIVAVMELNPAEEVEAVETVDVEEMVAEANEVVEAIKDMTPAEAVKMIDAELSKIDAVINTIEEAEERYKLRDIENHLKWVYGSLCEMIEEQEVEEVPAQQPQKKVTAYEKWLRTFIEEKGLDLDSEFTVEHEGNIHFINLGFLVETILKASKEEQGKIKDALVRLDFINGNVMHFFEHLAFAYIVHNY